MSFILARIFNPYSSISNHSPIISAWCRWWTLWWVLFYYNSTTTSLSVRVASCCQILYGLPHVFSTSISWGCFDHWINCFLWQQCDVMSSDFCIETFLQWYDINTIEYIWKYQSLCQSLTQRYTPIQINSW